MREPNVEMFEIIHRIQTSSLLDVTPVNLGSAAVQHEVQRRSEWEGLQS